MVYAQSALWTDDFTSQNARWEWSYHAGTGYHRTTTIEGLSVVEMGVTTASTTTAYSDCSVHEVGYTHDDGIVDLRLRYLGDGQMGTMGWGVWNYVDAGTNEAAWFFQAAPDGASMPLHAMVVKNATELFDQALPDIDVSVWHVYRVEFARSGTKFYVDNTLVAQTTAKVTLPQRVEVWVDNYQTTLENGHHIAVTGYRTFSMNQKIYLDYASFYPLSLSSTSTPSPSSTPIPTDTPVPSDTPIPTVTTTPVPTYEIGDVNQDRIVNHLDLRIIMNTLFKFPVTVTAADLNQNHLVDIWDYGILVKQFGKSSN